MKKKRYNFNNIKEMSDKKIIDPQKEVIKKQKIEWARKNPKYA